MGLFQVLREKWYPPIDPDNSFEGQSILVTGSNTGLGLEVAKKLASRNAKTLIITARSETKAIAAKQEILDWRTRNKLPQSTELLPMVLDMSSLAGVSKFLDDLKDATTALHSAILNAGAITPEHSKSVDNFEGTIQVNTVSTVFLAVGLVPILRSTAMMTKSQSHLTFVSSRNALASGAIPSSEAILSSSRPIRAMSEKPNFPDGTFGGHIQYGRSKLLLEYAIRHIATLPGLHDEIGAPFVIINSVCPGVVKTDLGRHFDTLAGRIGQFLFHTFAAKSASDGANAYLQALVLDGDSMGQLWAAGEFVPPWNHLSGDKGKAFGDAVWQELMAILSKQDQSMGNLLEAKVFEP